MSDRIHESFESYLRRVGLADAGPVQRRELRRAFYAGVWEMLCVVHEIGGESVSEADGVAMLGAMRAECEEFCSRVLEGSDWG